MLTFSARGSLEYTGWFGKWEVVQADGSRSDFRQTFIDWFLAASSNGRAINENITATHFGLDYDDSGEWEIDYTADGLIGNTGGSYNVCLNKRGDGWGFKNLRTYLEATLRNWNGRGVYVVACWDGLHVVLANPHEVLHPVIRRHNSESGIVSREEMKTICRAGEGSATCIFLTAGADGFNCERWGSVGEELLKRHEAGEMIAKRIGKCTYGGTEEKPPQDTSLPHQPAYRVLHERFLSGEMCAAVGTIVYKSAGYDYGLASDDERHTGREHISVTLDPWGNHPTFTIPTADLEPYSEQ